MTSTRLARMANQIAASVPDQSAEQTAAHLRSFWTPAMIATLRQEASDDPGILTDQARAALDLLTEEHTA